MPYVQRGNGGEIIGIFANRQPGYAEEWLGDGHPDLTGPRANDEAADAKTNINRHRDQQLAAGVLWAARRWQMDDVMRSALQWRITRWQLGRLAADATLPVRAMDNTIHPLGRDDHLALAEAIEAAGGAIYAESWAAKDAL